MRRSLYPSTEKTGSALLVTLLVVSLMLLVVVAFSAFIRMELRSVVNRQQLLQARASARLSANLAIANLQMVAGHDQRFTLPAWSDRDVSGTIPFENRFFSGARDAREFLVDDSGATPVLSRNPDFNLHQGWMVSGGDDFDISTSQFTTSGGSARVNPTSVLMVGEGSADPTLDTNGNGVPDDYVAVPLENIRDSSGRVREQLGYFVMDEGTKAKMNQFDPFRESATPEYSLLMAQQAAVTLVLPDFDASDEDQRAAVGRIYSDPQWALLEELLSGPKDQTMYQTYFHAITSNSYGLPVNVKAGGLKKDLTAIAEALGSSATIDPTTAPYTDLLTFHEGRINDRLRESLFYQSEGDFITPVQEGLPLRASQITTASRHKVFPPSSYAGSNVTDPGGPQWRQLLSFLNLGEKNYNAGTEIMDATVHSDEGHGTPPIMSRFHLRMQFTLTESGGDYLLGFHLIPNVAFWNPYDVALRVPETYIFQNISFCGAGGLPVHMRARLPGWHDPGESYWMPPHHFVPIGASNQANEGVWSSFPVMVRIPETVFEPGESIWFELDDHVEMEFSSATDGGAGGGFSFHKMEDGRNGSLSNSIHPSRLAMDMRDPANYALMKEGLDAGGSKSIYLQENFTWRSKSEAGAYARRLRSDWDVEPYEYARSGDRMQIQPDVVGPTLWRSWESRWVTAWGGNKRTPSGVPKYPIPSFQYATPDDPDTLKTFTFDTYTDGTRSGYEYGYLDIDALPSRANRLRNEDVINSVHAAGSGNPKLKVDAYRYNPWLRREETPNAWPNEWKNKKVFPLTFNENGIVYSAGPDDPIDLGSSGTEIFSPVDFSLANSVAVDKKGITTDWVIEEIRLGAGHEDYRADNPTSDWPSSGFGRGALLVGPDPSEFRGLKDQRTRPKVFQMAFNLYPAWPSSLLGDPWDPSYPGPSFTSLPSWDGTAGFIESVTGNSFGIVYALRSPEHGMTGDERVTFQIPWMNGYNPMVTYLAGDPLWKDNFGNYTKIGSGNPVMWVGGITEDPDLLDPMRATPDDRSASIGHSYEAFSETRTVLKRLPRSFEEFTSIGQLMHANPVSMGPPSLVSGTPVDHGQTYNPYKDGFRQTGGEYISAYAIGGGTVSDVIPPERAFRFTWSQTPSNTEENLTSYVDQQTLVETGPTSAMGLKGFNGFDPNNDGDFEYFFFPVYDYSLYLNNILWDDYMFTGAANSRLRWEDGVVDRDFDLSASRVLVEGAFNINSASPGAWAALLSFLMDMEIPLSDGSTDTDADFSVPVPRTASPVLDSYTGDLAEDYFSPEFYGGFRRLRPADIWNRSDNTGLAVEIVNAIAERGPFMSLADFVNRDPGADSTKYPHATTAQLEEYRRTSPLQMAINRSGLNGSAFGIYDSDSSSEITSGDYSATHPDGTPYHFWRYTENVEGPSNFGAPATLIQQDILASLGGFLQVRSDTFKIRAYGNVVDEVSGNRDAQAWCEIVVQRRSDYVDDADAADVRAVDLTSKINNLLGRRFEILSFRWLSPDEI